MSSNSSATIPPGVITTIINGIVYYGVNTVSTSAPSVFFYTTTPFYQGAEFIAVCVVGGVMAALFFTTLGILLCCWCGCCARPSPPSRRGPLTCSTTCCWGPDQAERGNHSHSPYPKHPSSSMVYPYPPNYCPYCQPRYY